ncbi:hypothetical protein CR513_14517, partial [Mucuna pruriens]
MDCLRALLNSTSKPLGSCGLTMNGKSSFNISDHVPIAGSDNVQIHSSLSLHNVLHVPKLANNLISIHRLIQYWNCAVTFFRSRCVIQELTPGRTNGVAKEKGKLYYLQHTKIGNNTNKKELLSSEQETSETWTTSQIWLYHKRLGYPPFGLLKTMFSYLFTKESVESFKCHIYQFSKHHCATFSPSNNKSLEPFDLIHSDVWGPASNFISRAKWFVSLHSNNGTEFVNPKLFNFLKDNGVVHELTCVNTPQQNGVAKRKNYHLLEVARALLFQMSIPNVYWGEVVLTTTYLINRLPTRVLNAYQVVSLGVSPLSTLIIHIMGSKIQKLSNVFSLVIPQIKRVLRESYLEVEPIIASLPFPTQDIQVQVQEVTPTQDVQVQKVTKPTLVLEQVQMSELDVSILDNSIEEQVQLFEPEVSIPDNFIEDVIDDMLIALRKGKRSCVKYPISQFVRIDHLSVQH